MEALLRREGRGVSENALLARARGYLLRSAVLAALTLLMTLLYASMAWAETFTVTNLKAAGPGSLRAAVNAAEARAGSVLMSGRSAEWNTPSAPQAGWR